MVRVNEKTYRRLKNEYRVYLKVRLREIRREIRSAKFELKAIFDILKSFRKQAKMQKAEGHRLTLSFQQEWMFHHDAAKRQKQKIRELSETARKFNLLYAFLRGTPRNRVEPIVKNRLPGIAINLYLPPLGDWNIATKFEGELNAWLHGKEQK